MSNTTTRINCRNLELNESQTIVDSSNSVSLVHREDDPQQVNRIIAKCNGLEVEILPSKGFSIGQIYLNGQAKLWSPPIGLCDPYTLDLYSDEVAINGMPAPGFTFLKTFSSGIEFYGLRNWGMPCFDKQKDFLNPIHGETSNIPIDFCDIEINYKEVILSASFIYRDMSDKFIGIWYKEGHELFEVERRVIISRDKPQLQLIDCVKNISNKPLKPDWGYHITFLPTDGSRLLVPSDSAENRSEGIVPEDFDTWSPAKNNELREETGIIHKGLRSIGLGNENLNYGLLVHPNHTGIKVSFPASPYFQTWFCKGGAFTQEFTNVSDGKPLFTRNWDGMGIEIGSSALDHNGNTDPSIPDQVPLNPGSSIILPLSFDFVGGQELKGLSEEFRKISENRVFLP